MTKYLIYYANKTYMVNNLAWALDLARRQSLVNFRVSIFKDNVKLATYENGDLKYKNY